MARTHTDTLSGLVWHYTDTDALVSIITKHRLWASSAAFMNDANEMITHQQALKKTYERIKADLPADQQELLDRRYGPNAELRNVQDLYLIAASEEGDHLTLWRNYSAKSGAFAIGLDASVRLKPVLLDPSDPNKEHPSPPKGYYEDAVDFTEEGDEFQMYDPDDPRTLGGRWRKVRYVAREGVSSHEARVRKEGKFLAGRARDPKKYQYHVDFTYLDPDNEPNREKDDAFKDEAEVRIIVSADPDWKFVKYRSGPFGLTPYVELATKAQDSWDESEPATEPGILPIREIRIGPAAVDPARQERSLRALLDANGYRGVIIRISEIPFR